jgi:hypothetical protein
VAFPVIISRAPEVPALVVPVLKTSAPLTPDVPELTDWTTIDPLDVSCPYPVAIEMDPPVAEVDRPESRVISPPEPVSPLPTEIIISPPFPAVAIPEFRLIFR